MRVAIYARYSSDNQRDASIADQLRICRTFAASKGWTVVDEFSDAAQSGATMFRSGVQALKRFAERGQCDVVLAEALDRFSRSLGDIAQLFERLSFADVKMWTISEGEIGDLHVGLSGTMNALYLKHLGEKTHRGQRGRVLDGKVAGGLCYGYQLVPGAIGDRVIDPVHAAIVRRIFEAYNVGMSPKGIAKQLNGDGVHGPRERFWSQNTINGNVVRGTGILNNELYIGRLVWNRLDYRKNLDTGKRVSRLNPQSAWEVVDVPHLRIIEDAVWEAAKRRQQRLRGIVLSSSVVRTRRPAYLFAGLTRCTVCGSSYCMSNRNRLTCTGARDRGICSNRQTILREEVETRVLRAMQDKLWSTAAFDAFCKRLNQRLKDHNQQQRSAAVAQLQDGQKRQKQIDRITALMADGVDSPSLRTKLKTLENEQQTEQRLPAVPLLVHPNMGDAYRQKVIGLRQALTQDSQRQRASELLRGFVEEIRLTPVVDGPMQIELKGSFAGVLNAANIELAWQSKLVAGARHTLELPEWVVAA